MRYEELLQTPLKHILATNSLNGFEELWETIERECSDILALYRENKKVFYRGAQNKGTHMFFKGAPRENRKPLDTNGMVHAAIDKWLVDHNFVALRSNSVFMTSNISTAGSYGVTYIVFPKNGFSYTWFEGAQDLFDELNAFARNELRSLDNIKHDHVAKQFLPHIKTFMEKVKPRNDNLVTPLVRENEVMFTGSEYYAVKKTGLGNVLDILLDIQEPPKDKAPGPWG